MEYLYSALQLGNVTCTWGFNVGIVDTMNICLKKSDGLKLFLTKWQILELSIFSLSVSSYGSFSLTLTVLG